MKPAPFTYHRAGSVAEAIELLSRLGDDAKIIAGGQSLVAMMNLRLARPSALVDVRGIPGLSYVRSGHDGLRIGALTRHIQVERYPADLSGFSLLPRAARWVGHHPIRTQGTLGGSLAHADPAAEWCILAALLDAEVTAAGPGGIRTIGADAFFRGYFSTALEADEVLTEVRFPRPARHAALQEFARRHGDFAVVAAAVAFDADGGVIRGARVALGGVDAQAVRVEAVESVLEGAPIDEGTWRDAAAVVGDAIDPPSDAHGSGDYRRMLAATLVQRALVDAASRDDVDPPDEAAA